MNLKDTPMNQTPVPPSSPLVEMLSPLYYGTKVLGLSPYKKTRNHFEKSILGSIVTFSAAAFFFLNAMQFIGYFFFDSNNIIVQITLRLRIYISFTSTLLIYANEMKSQKKFKHILESLKEIDGALINMGVEIPYSKSKKRITILVCVLFYWFTDFRLKVFNGLATFHTTIVMILLILWIVGLSVTCDGCISEAKKSAPILFRINCYSNMTNMIRLFAFQLMELPRDISAAGFFNVNRQLISTIFGSTATFLVILIQFDLASET